MEPGIISSTSGMDGDTTAYQVAMSLNGGNSGGPIFNEKGEVVAVVKGKSSEKEGTGYVVRSSYVWDLIKKYEAENDVKIKRPKWNQLSKKKRIQMIKHIRQFVFLVEAEK
jgi:serine protease Do